MRGWSSPKLAALVLGLVGCTREPAPPFDGSVLGAIFGTDAGGGDASSVPSPQGVDAGSSLFVSGPRAEAGICRAIVSKPELVRGPADIIWIVDNSPSMEDEIAAVQKNLNAFADRITAAGVDPKVVLISAPPTHPLGVSIPPPLGGSGRLVHVPVEVWSDNGLDIALSTYAQWGGALRAGALQSFVIVTDDNSYITSDAFVQGLTQRDSAFGDMLWTFSGIFCTAPSCSGGGSCVAQGTVYEELVQMTSGVAVNLCSRDFELVFERLANNVVGRSPLPCEFMIPDPPDGERLEPGKVNVRFATVDGDQRTVGAVSDQASCDRDLGGWFYDDPTAPTSIGLCPAACTSINKVGVTEVEVLFGCATEVLIK